MNLVSVLMPAYNASDSIGAAISSVLTQTHPNVELIVVDDGSSDQTPDICASYGSLITFIRTDNHGVAHARNVAADAAKGDYIAFCDADDQLLPPAVATSLERLAQLPANTVLTNEALILTSTGLDHGRRLIRGNVPKPTDQRMAILERNFVGIFSMFPRSLWEQVGGFDESLRQLEDWDLWLRSVYSGWQIALQPRPVAIYRMTTNSLSTRTDRYTAEARMLSQFRDFHRGKLSQRESQYLQMRLDTQSPTALRQAGSDALARGALYEARSIYRQLATLSPTNGRVRTRAALVSRVPGAARLLSLRQRALDGSLGGRVRGQSDTGDV